MNSLDSTTSTFALFTEIKPETVSTWHIILNLEGKKHEKVQNNNDSIYRELNILLRLSHLEFTANL